MGIREEFKKEFNLQDGILEVWERTLSDGDWDGRTATLDDIADWWIERCVLKEEVGQMRHDHEILVNSILDARKQDYISKKELEEWVEKIIKEYKPHIGENGLLRRKNLLDFIKVYGK